MPEVDESETEYDVVLADGGTAHLRRMRPDDDDALLGLYDRVSDESLYLRFLSPVPRPTARQLEQLTDIDDDRRVAIVAEVGDDVVAVARYARQGDDEAEVAFTVQDDQQGRGLGTIMLEQLAAIARAHGIRRFVAETLASNYKMLDVFAEAGFEITKSLDSGTFEVAFDIAPTREYREAQSEREHEAEARSVARILTPHAIAVIGASHRPGTIGNALVQNLLRGDFAGPVYPVNPGALEVAGIRAFPGVLDVPDPVDVAVVAVPAPVVVDVARDCARKGVRGLVVISAGFGETGEHERERELLALARQHGMRIIGPNCMGIVNTSANVRMNATFAPIAPLPGRMAFGSQSGGLGIELLARSRELGLGVSSFVSMGNKLDVSSNDLLQFWEDDSETDVILLYLESFGNPRKFARLARRISRRKPIIAVKSGRTAAGARGTSSHTAALATPDVAVDELFRQAGVIRVDTLEQLFDTASVVLHQPLPPGRRVAIVTNGGGPGILAADACIAAGLEVPELTEKTQAQLRAFTSPDAGLRNPVDLVASASAETYEHALRVLLADGGIDAVLAVFVPPLVTDPGDVSRAITTVAADAREKPIVACFLGRNGALDALDPGAGTRSVPSFAFPEAAAAALGRAAEHAAWRRRPEGRVPQLTRIELDRARDLVAGRLAEHPDGDWVDAEIAQELLRCFGVPLAQGVQAASAAEAAAAAEQLGFPVALKAASGAIVHKSDVGAVQLALESAGAVRDAFAQMDAALGPGMGGAIVQRMVAPSVETIVGITRDPVFGSLVLFGMGGMAAELLRDTSLRLVPLTDLDAHDIVRSLRASPLLFGYRNTPKVDVAALEDLVLRVGMLADQVPEVAELDCNPVIISPEGATVVDVKLRLGPPPFTPPPDVRVMAGRASEPRGTL